jgi:hypothetical protein
MRWFLDLHLCTFHFDTFNKSAYTINFLFEVDFKYFALSG